MPPVPPFATGAEFDAFGAVKALIVSAILDFGPIFTRKACLFCIMAEVPALKHKHAPDLSLSEGIGLRRGQRNQQFPVPSFIALGTSGFSTY